jgi:hypothetical protein
LPLSIHGGWVSCAFAGLDAVESDARGADAVGGFDTPESDDLPGGILLNVFDAVDARGADAVGGFDNPESDDLPGAIFLAVLDAVDTRGADVVGRFEDSESDLLWLALLDVEDGGNDG